MNVRLNRFLAALAALVMTAVVVVPAAFPAEAAKIKLATLAPKGSSIHQILQQMGEKWRQAPAGSVATTFFTDGSMGGEADMVRKMRIGQIQAAALTAVGLAEIDRSVSALQFMPMVFRSPAEIEHVIKKLSPKLEQTFLDKGFVVLGWTLAGWVNYFSKDPVLLPEDLKKMKLFVWAGDSGGVDLVKELGYQPVPLEIADILPGLQTGMIQAFPTIPVYANAGQFFTQATHMIQINWAPVVGGLVMNKKAWDRMPPAVQAEVRAAAMEAGQKISERSRKENEEAVSAMEKRGLKVKVPPPEAVDAWRKLAESVYPKIRGRIVPAPMFDEVMAILKEYRASGSNRGS